MKHVLTPESALELCLAKIHGPVTFEFRADKTGAFPFYCNLLTEDGCRQMRGELVVKPRK